jgi:hypothetical protein
MRHLLRTNGEDIHKRLPRPHGSARSHSEAAAGSLQGYHLGQLTKWNSARWAPLPRGSTVV